MEQLKPATNWMASGWFKVIVIVFLIIMLALFAPSIVKLFTGGSGAVAEGIGNAKQTITPLQVG